MGKKTPIVAIVGRTNVGKSTLFNALVGRRTAIVEDSPGVTRDRHYAFVTRYDFPFTLIDTGGMVGDAEMELQPLVRKQSEMAIAEADLVLVMFDGLEGLHPFDQQVADSLRRSRKPVLWVVNKCEKPATEIQAAEFFALGIEDPIFVSSAHRVGLDQLVKRIRQALEVPAVTVVPADVPTVSSSVTPAVAEEKVIKVAIIGKPNVGKSTLLNRIVGEERVVASDYAGTTTDSINVSVLRDGQRFILVDTAGIRKKARIEDATVERYSNLRALKALAEADVALLMLDATHGAPSEQDAKLAGLIHERGKGLIIVVNKWDAIEKDHRTVKSYKDAIQSVFKFARYAPILFVSSLSGRRCPAILQTAKEIYATTQTRVPTSELNKVLKRAFLLRPPPAYRAEPIKLFFATQVEVAPPTIVLFVNHPQRLNFSYERYIKNVIREQFPFEGCDIKLHFRKRSEKAERKGGQEKNEEFELDQAS